MWASSADMSNSWSKMVLTRITYFDHVALYADMSNSWSEMVLTRITYFDHVALKCGHEQFMVRNGTIKNHLF